MTRHDYGSGTDPLSNPLHSGWAGDIANDLDTVESSIAALRTTSLRDVSGIDPSSGQSLVWDEQAGVYVPRYAADAAGVVSLDYRYSVDTTVAQGEVATDNADPAAVTTIYMHTRDTNGVDCTELIMLLVPPFWVGITDQVNREQQTQRYYMTGAPVLTGEVWALPVTFRDAVGGPFTEGQAVYVIERFMAQELGDHGHLTGLEDDDHPQYVKAAGDTMTGNLTITNSNVPPAMVIADAANDIVLWAFVEMDRVYLGANNEAWNTAKRLILMGNPVEVQQDPTGALHVATKQYVDNGGEDSGWVPVPTRPGFVDDSIAPRVRRVGKIVHMQGGWNAASGFTANATFDVADIPVGFRPSDKIEYGYVAGSNGATGGRMRVYASDGLVQIYTGSTLGNYFMSGMSWVGE